MPPKLPPRPPASLVSAALDNVSCTKPPLPPRPSPPIVSAALQSLLNSGEDFMPKSNGEDPVVVHLNQELLANRCPPRSSFFRPTIATGLAISCIAYSRFRLVIGGLGFVKIFDMVTGDCLHSINLKGDVKVHSLAFLPSHCLDYDRRYFWAGLSNGELWMIDVLSYVVVEKRSSVHSWPVCFIIRHRLSMLTIDSDGKVQHWSRNSQNNDSGALFSSVNNDNDGGPKEYERYLVTLSSKPRTFRNAPNQISVTVFDDCVISCNERILETITLVGGANTRRIELPSYFGNICALTAKDVDEKRLFTGHADGKILEWSTTNFNNVRIIDTGSYRICSLQYLPNINSLWINTRTGKTLIVNLQKGSTFLSVLKEWQSEDKEYHDYLNFDNESCLDGSNELNIVTAARNGIVSTWNLLAKDDIECSTRTSFESQLFDFEELKLLICSWNINSIRPETLENDAEDKYVIDKWISSVPEGADVIVFGLQEIVDLESKSRAAKGMLKKKTTSSAPETDFNTRTELWKARLFRALRDNFKVTYKLLSCRNMVGILSIVFVRESVINRIQNCESFSIETGMNGKYGNKGAVITRFVVSSSSFCFLVNHLPAHQNSVGKRNADALTILKAKGFSTLSSNHFCFMRGGDGSQILDNEHIFFFGDLNYRIDLSYQKCLELVNMNDIAGLIEQDQLLKQKAQRSSPCPLRIFDEAPIQFLPTYKYDIGTNTYDTSEKRRVPAYCDRILFRSQDVHVEDYSRFECKASDHRPISASFRVRTKKLKNNFITNELDDAIALAIKNRVKDCVWETSCNWLQLRTDCAIKRAVIETVLKQQDGNLSQSIHILDSFVNKKE